MGTIIIGIAEMDACRGEGVLTTLGLGSCVGVALHDKTNLVGGLVHIMLPESRGGGDAGNRAKYADLGIPDLVTMMVRLGARQATMVAKLAGGAHMFQRGAKDVIMVGQRNVEACLTALKALGIPITAKDTGGSHGRTIELNTATGALKIKTVGAGEKII